MMADPILVLWEFLTVSGTDLYALVGDRVWCPYAPPSYEGEQAALIYHPDGQAPEAPRNVLRTSVVFKCYGGTDQFGKAREVALKLYDRLHMATGSTTSGEIVRARCMDMSQGGADPETGWPIQLARYEIITN